VPGASRDLGEKVVDPPSPSFFARLATGCVAKRAKNPAIEFLRALSDRDCR